MFSETYLAVRSVGLSQGQTWQPSAGGLYFVFIEEGDGKYTKESLTRVLRKGSVIAWQNEGLRNGELRAGPGGLSFKFFSLNVEQLYPLFPISELGVLEQIIEGFRAPQMLTMSVTEAKEWQQVLSEVPEEPSLEQRVRVLVIGARLLSKELKKHTSTNGRCLGVDEHMEQVFQSMSEEDFLQLSVPELALKFGCSRRHLTRLFHRFVGSSILDFRMELRLKRAKCLLRNPNMKIIQIAQDCGFNHVGYFNSAFRRKFGMSPGQWRKFKVETESEGHSLAGEPSAARLPKFLPKPSLRSGLNNANDAAAKLAIAGKQHSPADLQPNAALSI